MNDPLLFLACMTLFGLACIAVGWALRGNHPTAMEILRSRYLPDDTDEAGA